MYCHNSGFVLTMYFLHWFLVLVLTRMVHPISTTQIMSFAHAKLIGTHQIICIPITTFQHYYHRVIMPMLNWVPRKNMLKIPIRGSFLTHEFVIGLLLFSSLLSYMWKPNLNCYLGRIETTTCLKVLLES
jgi:hypothetical protein